MKTHARDLNTFRVGQRVDVVGLDVYQNIEITRISDSGVTINGMEGRDITLSGKTPAMIAVKKEIPVVETVCPTSEPKPESSKSYANKMGSLKIPDGAFTIRALAEQNDIPVPYAAKWVKENCAEAGDAPKVEGQRGRVAKLFKVNG